MPVYFAGAEDGVVGFAGASGFGSNPDIDTSAGRCRGAPYTRYGCGLNTTSSTSIRLTCPFTAAVSSFWSSGIVWLHYGGTGAPLSDFVQWRDASGVLRLVFQISSSATGSPSVAYNFYKVDAAGTRTLLATTTASGIPDATLTKLDFDINYATNGHINIYIAGALVGSSGTVDMTTDGNTAIAEMDVSSWLGDSFTYAVWSEIMVRSSTTLNLTGLVTLVPAGNGNTQQWTGSFSNMSGNTVDQTTPDFTSADGQMQEYTTGEVSTSITLSVPSSITVAYQAEAGVSSTVTDLAPVIRYGGTDVVGDFESVSVGSFSNRQESFGPAESNVLALTVGGINAAGFNIGVSS